ncbi:amidohydrolase [Hahella ganghwensis]|uniref:amidohydrolase n=1 Tax=Hahella ganghwensis TaxID=286420 RepID=UPI0003642A96|nr:amidohydrolase [Hahella ganghwensis]
MLAMMAGVSACYSGGAESAQASTEDLASEAADLLLTNGAVYTVDRSNSWAEAVAIKDNRIVFVGDTESAESFIGSNTRVMDLQGNMVMPGFHDVHIHALESGSDSNHFILDSEETDAESFVSEIQKSARGHPDVSWLIGYGHSIYALLEAERSPLEILDEAVPDRPVIIMEQTSHSMWVNSKALEEMNINAATSDPQGGIIMKNEDGSLSGILIDNAGDMVMERAMNANHLTAESDYLSLKEYTMPEFAKHGITSVVDARGYWQRNHHKTWQRLADNDELTMRVSLALWAYPELDDQVQLNTLTSLYRQNPGGLLRINQIKLYSDGILHNTTAALKQPYDINLLNIPGNRGLNYFTQERIEKYITALEPVGYDFLIHAIGDRGVHESLNAIENAGTQAGRHRLTHVEMVDSEDLPRFAELNITADAQVAGEFTQPSMWHHNDELVGTSRADNLVPIRSLRENGARVTLSSDWSVSPFNPMIGLQNAVTRDPQALSLTQAIRAYTIDSAYSMRQETQTGSIESGKLADLIILDRNLFDIAPESIHQAKVLMTIFDGEVIFEQR